MIKGPEAIVFDSNGSIYTGLSNGQIVRIDPNGHVEKIVQIGEEMDERVCDNLKRGYVAAPPCGRPYGLRMKPNTNELYVADSFYGIVKVDLEKS
jgi:DNA-binding beta-propeller fold protein YncE